MAINALLQSQVRAKLAVLSGFLTELEGKAGKYAAVMAELAMDPAPPPS